MSCCLSAGSSCCLHCCGSNSCIPAVYAGFRRKLLAVQAVFAAKISIPYLLWRMMAVGGNQLVFYSLDCAPLGICIKYSPSGHGV